MTCDVSQNIASLSRRIYQAADVLSSKHILINLKILATCRGMKKNAYQSVEFSWTVGSASTIEKTETCCSLNALLQF